jgi:hypothetical protein
VNDERQHDDPDAPKVADGSQRQDPQAMGDQPVQDIKSSLPPGASTKPDDARGDVDRLEPYEDAGDALRMSDVEVPPAQLQDDAP